MTDPTDTTPGQTPVVPPVVENAGAAPLQGQQQVNWEARYNGLNTAFQKLQKKFDDLQGNFQQLSSESEELRQTLKKHEADKGQLSSSLQALETEKASLLEQVKTHAFSGERMSLILQDFPELASFEADKLLPTASTLEELRPKLESFRNKLGNNIKNGVQQKLQGAGPAQTAKNDTQVGGHTEDYIYNRMLQLSGHRTPEQETEYLSLRDEWDVLKKPS